MRDTGDFSGSIPVCAGGTGGATGSVGEICAVSVEGLGGLSPVELNFSISLVLNASKTLGASLRSLVSLGGAEGMRFATRSLRSISRIPWSNLLLNLMLCPHLTWQFVMSEANRCFTSM